MSNECINQLVVVGLITDLARFKKVTCIFESYDDREVELCTDSHIPLCDSNGLNRAVCAQACVNVNDATLEFKDSGTGYGCLDFEFPSRWDPPIQFVRRASALFPFLEFHLTYMEEGCGFAGQVTYLAGEPNNGVRVEYIDSDERLEEYLGRPKPDPWKDGLFPNPDVAEPNGDSTAADTMAGQSAD